jgi:hypothetical protein
VIVLVSGGGAAVGVLSLQPVACFASRSAASFPGTPTYADEYGPKDKYL